MVSASLSLKNSVMARGELVKRLSYYLDSKLKLPEVKFLIFQQTPIVTILKKWLSYLVITGSWVEAQ